MAINFYDYTQAPNICWCHIHNTLLHDLVFFVAVLLDIFQAKHIPQIRFKISAKQTSAAQKF
jgi:hypothetical protein